LDVELIDGPIYIQEDLLNCFFCLCVVAKDSPRDPINQRTMPLKQDGQRIVTTTGQLAREFLVPECAKLAQAIATSGFARICAFEVVFH
jgi:hypothetical protein